MVIQGVTYEDRETAGAALLKLCAEIKDKDPVEIGSYRGFTMALEAGLFRNDRVILRGAITYTAELGSDPRGNLIRIDHALEKMPDTVPQLKHPKISLFFPVLQLVGWKYKLELLIKD